MNVLMEPSQFWNYMHFRPDTTEWIYDRCIFEWSTVCPLSIMCREYYFETDYAAIISNSIPCYFGAQSKKVTPNIDQNGEAFGLSRLCSAIFELLLALEGIFSNFEQEFCLPKQFLTKI